MTSPMSGALISRQRTFGGGGDNIGLNYNKISQSFYRRIASFMTDRCQFLTDRGHFPIS
jgi:hypothetical protein